MSRPSDYNELVADQIVERLSEGLSLRQICDAEDMPARSTVLRWVRDHASFRALYALARELQIDLMADEILDVADDGSNDWMEGRNGEEVVNGEAIARSRLRVDTRKWLLSKLMPKKYGDKLELAGDPAAPIVIEKVIREIVDPAPRDPESI